MLPETHDPRRWRMLPVLLIGSFLAFLDFFIVNIALPAMRTDLGARPAQLQFVIAGYGIGFAVTLVTGGRLGDIFGRRRVFLLGVGGFTLASLICGLAPDPDTLIAARVMQAMAAACMVPQVLAIIRIAFPAGEQAAAIGLYGSSMGLASIAAQLLGGALVSLDLFGLSWRLIFLVNLPAGLAAIVLALRMVPESHSTKRPTLDPGGMALVTLALLLLIYPLVEGREAGWPGWSFAMLAAAVPGFAAFAWHERRVMRAGRMPLVALHLLRIPALALGLVLSVIFFAGLGVFFVVLTVFLQQGVEFSAFAAGLMFLPFAVGFSVTSALSGPIGRRVGDRVLPIGILLMLAGLGWVVALAAQGAAAGQLVAAFLIYGLGQGMAQPAVIAAVLGASGVTGEDAGAAAGLFLTVAQSAIALGVAAIGDVFFTVLSRGAGPKAHAAALVAALSCNLALLATSLVLVLALRRLAPAGGSR